MKFGKKVGVLTVGTAVSQGVMLLGIIILSRVYSPEDFGLYAVVFGVATIASVASSFRYEMTILLPKSNKLSETALRLSFSISFFVNALGLMGMVILITFDLLAPYWVAAPLTAFFASIINISSFLQNRKAQYTRIVSVQIMRSILFILLAALAYGFEYGGNGLVLAMVLSMGLVAGFLLLVDFRNANAFVELLRRRRLHAWARKNQKFAFYSTPAVLVNSLATQAPIFLLSTLVGASLAGYYMLIQRVMMSPVTLVSGAVNKVYLQAVASRRANGEAIYPFTKSIVRRFLFPGVMLACTMFFAFKLRFLESLFGAQWQGIDTFSIIMIPAFCISFVAKSIAGFSILGRNEIGLIYQLVLLLLVSFAILISTYFSGSNNIIFLAISMALSLCFLGQSVSILKISKKLDEEISR